MVEAIQRFFESATSLHKWTWRQPAKPRQVKFTDAPKVGKFYADYSEVPRAELQEAEDATSELLRGSKLISSNRGL